MPRIDPYSGEEIRPEEEVTVDPRTGLASVPPATPTPAEVQIAKVEDISSGTMPTHLTLALTVLGMDDEELIRATHLFSRLVNIPPILTPSFDDPYGFKRMVLDKEYREDVTFENLVRSNKLYEPVALYDFIAKALTKDPDPGSHGTAAPSRKEFARATRSLAPIFGEVDAYTGLGLVVEVVRGRYQRNKTFAQNLQVIKGWVDATARGGEFDAVAQVSMAMDITDERTTLENSADLIRALSPAIAAKETAEIAAAADVDQGTYDPEHDVVLGTTAQAGIEELAYEDTSRFVVRTSDLQARIAELEAVLAPENAVGLKRFEGTWFDRNVVQPFDDLLDDTAQVAFQAWVNAETPFVIAYRGLKGDEDPVHQTMLDRTQNLEYIDETRHGPMDTPMLFWGQPGVPAWQGATLDFLIGWYADPLSIVGGAKALRSARRAAVGLGDKTPGLVTGLLVKGLSRSDAVVDLASRYNARQLLSFEQKVQGFADSRAIRKVFQHMDDPVAYKSRFRRFKGIYHAGLDEPFMLLLRDEIADTMKYGKLTEAERYDAFKQGILAQFTGAAPPGTPAHVALFRRAGLHSEADRIMLETVDDGSLSPENLSQYGPLSGVLDDPAILPLRLEIPRPTSYVPGRGLAKTLAARSTERVSTSRVRQLFTLNPGRIIAFEADPTDYIRLNAERAGLPETQVVELMDDMARASTAFDAGREGRMENVLLKMDEYIFDAKVRKVFGKDADRLDPLVRAELHRGIYDELTKQNARRAVFGVVPAELDTTIPRSLDGLTVAQRRKITRVVLKNRKTSDAWLSLREAEQKALSRQLLSWMRSGERPDQIEWVNWTVARAKIDDRLEAFDQLERRIRSIVAHPLMSSLDRLEAMKQAYGPEYVRQFLNNITGGKMDELFAAGEDIDDLVKLLVRHDPEGGLLMHIMKNPTSVPWRRPGIVTSMADEMRATLGDDLFEAVIGEVDTITELRRRFKAASEFSNPKPLHPEEIARKFGLSLDTEADVLDILKGDRARIVSTQGINAGPLHAGQLTNTRVVLDPVDIERHIKGYVGVTRRMRRSLTQRLGVGRVEQVMLRQDLPDRLPLSEVLGAADPLHGLDGGFRLQGTQQFPGDWRTPTLKGVGDKKFSVADIARDMGARGIREPIELLHDSTTGEFFVYNGHHRLLAAEQAGLKDVPVKWSSIDGSKGGAHRRVRDYRARHGLGDLPKMMEMGPPLLDGRTISKIDRKVENVISGTADLGRMYSRYFKAGAVARPAYVTRVILLDENMRFIATRGLMERLYSHRLRFLGGRALDDLGLFDVPIRNPAGETVAVLKRSGSISYRREPLASQRTRDVELMNEVVRDLLGSNTAARLKGWMAKSSTDVGHMADWTDALIDMETSRPGTIALASVGDGARPSQTAEELKTWARGEGHGEFTSRLARGAEDVDQWGDDLAAVVHHITAGSPDIAKYVLLRPDSQRLKKHLERMVPSPKRPEVAGHTVAALTKENWITGVVNQMYRAFVSGPEDVINRQPYFRSWKRAADGVYLRGIAAEGVELTDDLRRAVDVASTRFGLEQVNRIMFDFTKKQRIMELMEMFFPFPQPFFEGFQAWGHILFYRKPRTISHARMLFNFGVTTGVLSKNSEGEYTLPHPLQFFLHTANLLDDRVKLPMRLSNLNMFTSSTMEIAGVGIPMPSLNPAWQSLLQELLKDSTNDAVVSYLFAYGPGTPLLPNSLNNLLKISGNEQYNAEEIRRYTLQAMREIQYLGLDVDADGNPLPYAEIEEMARTQATSIVRIQGASALVGPTTASVEWAHIELYEELANLRETLGFTEGTDAFNEKYDYRYTLLTVGTTRYDRYVTDPETGKEYPDRKVPRIPTSEFVAKLTSSEEGKAFIKTYGYQWLPLLLAGVDPATAADFDFTYYARELEKGFLKGRDPKEFWGLGDAAKAWPEWIEFRDGPLQGAYDLMVSKGSTTTGPYYRAYTDMKRDKLYELSLLYPAWAETELSEVPSDDPLTPGAFVGYKFAFEGDVPSPPPVIWAQAQALVTDPSLNGLPGMDALRFYMDERMKIAEIMDERGYTDIRQKSAQDQGLTERYETMMARIEKRWPEAFPLIDSYFYGDLQGYEAEQFETLNGPDGEKYQKLSIAWEEHKVEHTDYVWDHQFFGQLQQTQEWLNTQWRARPKVLRTWFDAEYRKGTPAHREYMFNLAFKEPIFMSAFELDLMGLTDAKGDPIKLSNQASKWIEEAAKFRQTIAKAKFEDPTISTGVLYEALNIQIAGLIPQDESFAAWVRAADDWGWGLEQARLTDQPGSLGDKWTDVVGALRDLQTSVRGAGLNGIEFGSDDERKVYDFLRKDMFAQVKANYFDDKRFKHQWFKAQEAIGSSLIEYLMPDTYFQLGVVPPKEE